MAQVTKDSLQVPTHRRLDVQGLRAIAVLAVVAFHAGLPVPGGFVGVDIFFVISGYVITAMLYREWTTRNTISLKHFFWRRFKRLTPALALMVSCTLLLTFLFLSPLGAQQRTADTGIGAMVLLANLVISRTTGNYFDPPAESNPLLNTWSLSVEEQFYLIFPILLIAIWTISRKHYFRWLPLVAVFLVTVGSFVLAVASTQFGLPNRFDVYIVDPFYSPFARAWEFGIGALLALGLATRLINTPRSPGILSFVGSGLLFASLWVITPATPFPSAWTLLPTIGAALLILAGAGASPLVNRLLSSTPAVKVGDWSYSIYLWHWPLIVLAVALWPLVQYAALFAAFLSLIPSWISYRWVESPLRQVESMPKSKKVALIFLTLSIPTSLGLFVKWGATNFWQPQYTAGSMDVVDGDVGHSTFLDYKEDNYPLCAASEIRALALVDAGRVQCHQSIPNQPVEVAIVGDSHADHLFPGLADHLPETNIAYYTDEVPSFGTTDKMDRILSHVVGNDDIKVVILSAIWHARGVPVNELRETLSQLESAGKRVFILDDIPDFPFEPTECKYRRAPILPGSRCSWSLNENAVQYAKYASKLKASIETSSDAQFIEINKYFCDDTRCSMRVGDTLMYRDSNHLNLPGTRYVAERLLVENPDLVAALQRPFDIDDSRVIS